MKKIMNKMLDGMFYAIALAFIVALPLAVGAAVFGFATMAGAGVMTGLIGGVLAAGFVVSICTGAVEEAKDRDGFSRGAASGMLLPQIKKQLQPAPQPLRQPLPQPPREMDHAISAVDRMNADDRRVFIEKLSSRFPSEVEALHAYDEKMALKRPATVMKPIEIKRG